MTDLDWKSAHAEAAGQALDHPLVQTAMIELRDNLAAHGNPLITYGIAKVAHYAAQVARAQAQGWDPDLLRLTPSEATSEALRFAAQAVLDGIPVHYHDPDNPPPREGPTP